MACSPRFQRALCISCFSSVINKGRWSLGLAYNGNRSVLQIFLAGMFLLIYNFIIIKSIGSADLLEFATEVAYTKRTLKCVLRALVPKMRFQKCGNVR